MATSRIGWENKEGLTDYEVRINQVQDRDMNEIKTVVNTNADETDANKVLIDAISSGYQGELLIADTPTEDGYYLAGESGTYTNAGSVVVDLTVGITYINVSGTQTVFTKTVIPVDTIPTGDVAQGETLAVSGGKVFDFTDELHTRDENIINQRTNSEVQEKAEYDRGTPASSGTNYYYRDDAKLWTLIGAVINSDGTITINIGGSIDFGNIGRQTPNDWYYIWLIEKSPIKDEIPFDVWFQFNGVQTMPSQYTLYDEKQNGVYFYGMINTPNYSWMNFIITNSSSRAVTIYPPLVTQVLTDDAPSYKAYDIETPIADVRPLNKFEWFNDMGNDIASRSMLEKYTTKSADSIDGSNSNDGLSILTPKLDISAIPPLEDLDVVGLTRESEFREAPPTSNGLKAISYIDLSLNNVGQRLPRISGLKIVPQGDWVSNGNGTYTYTFTSTDALTDNAYDEVYVVEIDTTTESDLPISSEVRMLKVADVATVISTIGSQTSINTSGNIWEITIHPTDGQAPNTKYRYEVTDKYYLIDDRSQLGGRLFQGIEYTPSCEGYGLAMPRNSIVDRSVFKHGAIHQLVQHSGVVQRSLFYCENKEDSLPLTFYRTTADGDNWSVINTFFYDVANIYCHISSGINFKEGLIKNVICQSQRDSINSLRGIFGSGSNIDKIVVDNCYVESYAFIGQGVGDITIKNSLFNKVSKIFLSKLTENNIFLCENFNDADSINNRGMGIKTDNQNADAIFRNNLVVYQYKAFEPLLSSDDMIQVYGTSPSATFERNVYVCDSPLKPVKLVGYTTVDWVSDYNVIIVIDAPSEFTYDIVGVGTHKTWELYQEETGQDANSLYIDLKNDPRGYDAVFIDYANGDLRWASTDVGKKIGDYCRINNVGTDWVVDKLPNIPTVDEAYNLIKKI